MKNGFELKSRKINGIAWSTFNEIERVFGTDFAQEVIDTSPVIRVMNTDSIRTKEVEDLLPDDSDEIISYNDEDSNLASTYDLYDIYLASSHHIIAASTLIEMYHLNLEDFSDSFKKMMMTISPSDREKRVFRKEIIEKVINSL